MATRSDLSPDERTDHDTGRGASQLPIGVGVGLAVGVLLGIVMDNLALGMAVGLAIGCGWGVSAASISRTTDQVHRRRIEDRW